MFLFACEEETEYYMLFVVSIYLNIFLYFLNISICYTGCGTSLL